jgi:hypothetical protein
MPRPRRLPTPISSPVVVAATGKIPNFRSLLVVRFQRMSPINDRDFRAL